MAMAMKSWLLQVTADSIVGEPLGEATGEGCDQTYQPGA